MRLLAAVIYKEFLQLIRNRLLLFLVLVCPLVILGVIPLSFDGSTRLKAGVYDGAGDYVFIRRAGELGKNKLFCKVLFFNSIEDAEMSMERGELDMIIHNESFGVHIITDGTFPRRALNALFITDVSLFENDVVPAAFHTMFNSGRQYNHYLLVSLIVLVITLVGTALVTLNLVRERESGVEEQFRATIMNRYIYFAGKFCFFVLLCFVQIVLCFVFCNLVYGLQTNGSFGLYLIVNLLSFFPLLGMGFAIAAFSRKQLQAVYLLTIVLVLFTMMSTMFTHLSSMPAWAAALRYVNPVYYATESSRMIIFKGAKLLDLGTLIIFMIVLGVFFLLVWWFRDTRKLKF